MLMGDIRNQIDRIWDTFWNGATKVDRSNMDRIPIAAPPLPLQHEFARRAAVEKL